MTGTRPAGAVRLVGLHWKVAALNELQYRANFWVQLVNSVVTLVTGLVAIALVYSHTTSLGGWSRPELLTVMGVHILVGGLLGALVEPNMYQLMEDVEQGTLDYALTRPADAQLLVSVRRVSLWKLVDVLTGLAVVIWGSIEVGGVVGMVRTAGFVGAVLCGTVILYCVWISATTLTFKITRGDDLMQLLTGVYQAGRWPVTVYPGWLRGTLTFLVPLAFAVTVPAQAVTNRIGWPVLMWAPVAAAIALLVTRLIWRWGIRNYSGASA